VPLSDITGVDPALLPSAVLAGGKRVLHPAGVTGMSNLSPLGSGEFKPIFEMALAARAAPGAAFPPGSELTYHTGDHVSVMPQGSEAAALALCDRLGWDPALRFAIEATKPGVKLPFTAPTTLLNALTRHVDVGAAVTPQMLRVLGSQAANAAEASALAQLASDATAYTKQVRQRYVRLLDVLHAFPSVHLPLDRLLAAWPLIVPRYYSICSAEPLGSSSGSSSGPSRMLVSFKQLRMAVDGQAPGTHAQLEAGAFQAAAAIRRHAERTGRASGAPGHPGGRVFEGLASTYMATRRLGDEVDVSVRHSSFRLPEDPSVPVCMIAGGIGITPFRAFLEHRVSRVLASAGSGAPVRYGPSMLLLGCRNETDHVYGDIARQALFCGALTRYDVAYAVPTAGSAVAPRLADELILSHGQAIWDALRVGGIVYVCGGASGFGMAVARAVKRVIAQHGGMSAEASEAYMAQLLEGCRFLEDLAD
jgi:sulfite reductase alpha subunit-like flavoprotein